jgi:hypothetical protein
VSLTLQQAGELVGSHCWAERQGFALLGAWVPTTADADAKVLFDRHSAHCAWRAGQWEERLPVLAGVSRPGLIAAPGDGAARLWDAAARLEGDEARLAAAYRVLLPRLAGAYRRHLDATTEVADGPTRRTLVMALADVGGDWVEGEALLQSRLAGPEGALAVAGHVAALEAALLGG